MLITIIACLYRKTFLGNSIEIWKPYDIKHWFWNSAQLLSRILFYWFLKPISICCILAQNMLRFLLKYCVMVWWVLALGSSYAHKTRLAKLNDPCLPINGSASLLKPIYSQNQCITLNYWRVYIAARQYYSWEWESHHVIVDWI